MKIIHTSDWDLGKFVNEFSMIEEQERCLKNFIKYVEKSKAEAIIFAGNFYNRMSPTKEAINLLDKTLNTLIVNNKIKVLGVLGDCDSPERISFGSHILEGQGLYLVGRNDEIYRKVTLKEDGETVNVYLIPYKTPNEVSKILNDKTIKTYEDALKKIIETIKESKFNKKDFNIAVYHGYVSKKAKTAESYIDAGLEISSLERPISFEGKDIVKKSLFKDFDYVALGHLHKGQEIEKNIVYSGALEKFSFEEENEVKSVVEIEIEKNKLKNVSRKSIKGLRNFKTIEIDAKDLENETLKKNYDYLNVQVNGKCEILNLLKALRKFYPNIMQISSEKNLEVTIKNNNTVFKNMNPVELFEEYYKTYGSNIYSDEKKEFIKYIAEKSLRKESE